jgi:magnesium transporter
MINFYRYGDSGTIKINNWEKNSWVNIEQPSSDEKKFLVENLKIPIAFLNDIEDIDERPRIELENNWLFIILRLPIKTNDEDLPFYTIPLGIILKEDIFVTVCFYKTQILDDFIKYTLNKKIAINSSYELILRLLISSSVWFSKYLKQINKTMDLTENSLDKKIDNHSLQKLFSLEKSLIYFTTTLTDHTFLFRRLIAAVHLRDKTPRQLIDDVEIELQQAQTTTKIYYDILRRMEDSYDSRISNNLNNVMKHLTSISIILMIPTLVASFYGMNVPNFFEDSPIAFAALIIGSFALSIIGFIFFKKIDWF